MICTGLSFFFPDEAETQKASYGADVLRLTFHTESAADLGRSFKSSGSLLVISAVPTEQTQLI